MHTYTHLCTHTYISRKHNINELRRLQNLLICQNLKANFFHGFSIQFLHSILSENKNVNQKNTILYKFSSVSVVMERLLIRVIVMYLQNEIFYAGDYKHKKQD